MKRMFKLFWLPMVVVASACAFSPNMGAAMSDQYLAGWDVGEAEKDAKRAQDELEAMGFRVMERTDGIDRLTTLPDKVLVPIGFPEWPARRKAEMLRHELAHAKQWQALGVYLFGAKYAHESGRWVLEMHGMRQQIRDACDYGMSREALADFIDKAAANFPKKYLFTKKNHAKVIKATREALLAELETCDGDPS